jgi:hypothetical protein
LSEVKAVEDASAFVPVDEGGHSRRSSSRRRSRC